MNFNPQETGKRIRELRQERGKILAATAYDMNLEGIGLGAILVTICCAGIRKGAVGMVHLYHKDVQDRCVELGLTTHEKIKSRAAKVRMISMPIYIA